MTSAFPAQYGNALAGVFDLKLRDGNNEQHEYLAQVGFNGLEVGAEGPFSKTARSSYLINYRYSTLGLFQKIGVEFGTGSNTPLYQDLNFKIAVPLKKGKLTLFGIAGTSEIDLLGSKADLDANNNLYGSENEDAFLRYFTSIVGASLEKRFSEKTYGKIVIGSCRTGERFSADSLVRSASHTVVARYLETDARFQTFKYSANGYARVKFSARDNLTVGFNLDFLRFTLYNHDFFANVNKDSIRIDIKDVTALYQHYISWKHRFSQYLLMNLGIHQQYYTLNKEITLEPRVSLQMNLNERSSVGVGVGMHSQIPGIYTSFVQTQDINGDSHLSNRDLLHTRSIHYALSYDVDFSDELRLKSEIYYQSLEKVPVETQPSSFSSINTGASFIPVNQGNLINRGEGKNYGIEFTLERFYAKGFYFLITGSLFESKYTASDRNERNTAFNTKYASNFLVGKEFGFGKRNNYLSFSVKFTTIGGKPFTPVDYDQSKAVGHTVYKEASAFSQRQTPYARLDLKASYRKEYAKSTLEAGVDIQNATNRQNIFSTTYNPRIDAVVTQYQQSFFPIPYFRFTF
jgi:hypothetical protein